MNIPCICVSYCYLSLLLPGPAGKLQALHNWTFFPPVCGMQVNVTAQCWCWIALNRILLVALVNKHFTRFLLFNF